MQPLPRAMASARTPVSSLPMKSSNGAPCAPALARERRRLPAVSSIRSRSRPRPVVVVAASCPAGFSSSSPPPPEEEETSTSKRRAKELEAVSTLPRPTGNRRRFLPLVGETQPHLSDHLRWAMERVWRHGSPVFRSSLYGMSDIVVATDFASIEKVMGSEHVLTEWFQPASFQRLLGTASSASIMADKQRHSRQRRQQAKAFSPVALSSYAPRVAAATERAVALWAAASGEEEAIDLGLALSDLTWAYALATVVDVSLDAEESRKVRTAWEDFTKNLFSAPLDFPGSRFRTALRARETLSKAMGRAVREYKASFEEENGKEKEGKEGKEEGDGKNSSSDLPTMMSIYMRARADDGDPLGEEELVDMSIGLLLAGYETSHSAHLLLLSVLASPSLPARVKQALEQEQREVVAKHGTTELTAAALADMPYADACSRWCLWTLGPADGIFRRAIADFELGGKKIKSGEVIYNSFLAAKATDSKVLGAGGLKPGSRLPPPHMDVNNLAASFAPERFLGGNGGGGDSSSAPPPLAEPTSVATFGFANHFCLGAPLYSMEAKAIVATLVRGYELRTADGREPMRYSSSWAATSRSGQRVKVKVSKKK